ncbi:MHO_4530 family protein [Mycoplasma phocoeninasale]|uniref:MHO_4530 family protein n=1 Tax=Mycoplasma phocoeninasale TaxID=2726117 RepID=UPI00196727B9|nr:hypothetical protein [Mycoplasma phocoeninasale]MBN0970480.1 hypothetical protein [Mycoplasma phocoeninasale]
MNSSNNIHEEYNVLLVIIWLISIVLIFLAVTFLIFIIGKRRYAKIQNSEGYMSLSVDLKKSRIKINNDSEVRNVDPWFFRKTALSSGKWVKLSDFLNCLPSEIKEQIENLLQAKKAEKIRFSIIDNKMLQIQSFIKFQVNNFESDLANCFIEWKNFSVKDEKVFKEIEESNEYLFDEKNKYFALAFILNVSNISTVENFINLFKKQCAVKEIFNIKPILKWNKLFFIFPFEDFSPVEAKAAIEQIVTAAKTYVKCYSRMVTFNNQLLNNISEEKFNILFDYIKIRYAGEKQGKLIEISNKWLEENDFIDFEKQYKIIEDDIKESKIITNEEILFKNFSNKKFATRKLTFKNRFLELNHATNDSIKNLDIYKDLIFNFYDNVEKYKLNNSLVFIEDFILNSVGPEKIIFADAKCKNLIQIIEFGNLNSINNLKIMLEKKLKGERINLAIKINKISEPIVNLISPWIKFIWIGENITSRLSDPATLLLLNSLFKKAMQHDIKVVLEKLNYKFYKKVLYKYKQNIIYTNID